MSYKGKVNWTKNNRKCQHWKKQRPHKHPVKDATKIPDDSLDEAQNYCRNPAINHIWSDSPWCYTTDRKVEWEFCNIPKCGKQKLYGSQCKQ